MKAFIKRLTIMAVLLLPFICFTSCEKDDIDVSTGTATHISRYGALVTSNVKTDKSLRRCTLGVLYSTSRGAVEDGSGADATTREIAPDGSYTVSLSFSRLSGYYPSNTKFYYRAYVIKDNYWYFGDIKTLHSGTDE